MWLACSKACLVLGNVQKTWINFSLLLMSRSWFGWFNHFWLHFKVRTESRLIFEFIFLLKFIIFIHFIHLIQPSTFTLASNIGHKLRQRQNHGHHKANVQLWQSTRILSASSRQWRTLSFSFCISSGLTCPSSFAENSTKSCMKSPTAPLGAAGIWVREQPSKRKSMFLARGKPGPRSSIHVRDLDRRVIYWKAKTPFFSIPYFCLLKKALLQLITRMLKTLL